MRRRGEPPDGNNSIGKRSIARKPKGHKSDDTWNRSKDGKEGGQDAGNNRLDWKGNKNTPGYNRDAAVSRLRKGRADDREEQGERTRNRKRKDKRDTFIWKPPWWRWKYVWVVDRPSNLNIVWQIDHCHVYQSKDNHENKISEEYLIHPHDVRTVWNGAESKEENTESNEKEIQYERQEEKTGSDD